MGRREEGFYWNNKCFWIFILFVLGIILSYLQPLRLVEGGEITYMSMLAIYLIGYFYGGKCGIMSALTFGIVQYFFHYPFILNIPELWDYVLGYGLLGVGGFLSNKRQGIYKGYLLAVLLRYIESVLNCVYFYYMNDASLWENIRYGLVYCGGYIGTETFLTLVVLCIPVIRECIEYIKYIATNEYEDDLDSF